MKNTLALLVHNTAQTLVARDDETEGVVKSAHDDCEWVECDDETTHARP